MAVRSLSAPSKASLSEPRAALRGDGGLQVAVEVHQQLSLGVGREGSCRRSGVYWVERFVRAEGDGRVGVAGDRGDTQLVDGEGRAGQGLTHVFFSLVGGW